MKAKLSEQRPQAGKVDKKTNAKLSEQRPQAGKVDKKVRRTLSLRKTLKLFK